MKRIFTNTSFAIIAQLVTIVSGFILPRAILEQYGSEVNGLVQSISQFLGIISFMDLGIGQVARSALYGPLAKHEFEKVSAIMRAGRTYYQKIAYMLVGYVILLIFLYPVIVNHSFSRTYVSVLLVAMATNTFCQFYFGIVNEQLLHADQKSYIIFALQIGGTLINLIVCVWMIKAECSIQAVKAISSFIFITRPLVYLIYISKSYPLNLKIQYRENPLPQRWSGLAQHVSSVVLDGTDNIVLTVFSTLTSVSIYSVYFMVIAGIQAFYQSAAVGIQSAAGEIWAKNENSAIKKMFVSAEFGLHSLTVFLFSCTCVLIVPFVRVYTDGLTDANYIQPIFAFLLVLAYGIRCLRTPYNIWILAAGHFKQTQNCHIVAAAMNVIISVIAVSRWGLVGVAIGTLIAMCYQTAWMSIYTALKLIKCSLAHIVKRYAVDIAAMVAVIAAASWIKLPDVSYWGWFIMAIQVAVMSFICVAVLSIIFYGKETNRVIKRFALKSVTK